MRSSQREESGRSGSSQVIPCPIGKPKAPLSLEVKKVHNALKCIMTNFSKLTIQISMPHAHRGHFPLATSKTTSPRAKRMGYPTLMMEGSRAKLACATFSI